MATFAFMFLSTTGWFEEIKQFHEPLNYGACDAHAFYVFIKNATKMVWIILLNTKTEDQALR